MDNKPDEDALRRQRINRYKKIIMFSMLVMIIVPIILCIILFCRVSVLERKLDRYIGAEGESNDSFAEDTTSDDSTTKNDTDEAKIPDNRETSGGNIGSVYLNTAGPYRNWTEAQADIIKRYAGMGEGRKIYLTFDDGPSIYTNEILDILEYYGVKATFFVLGKEDEMSLEGYRAIAASGNTIGLHSYSHKYDNIYSSVEAFEKDLLRVKNLVFDVTGIETKYYRFPGGTSTARTTIPIYNFIDYLNSNGYVYFDWNAVCGDGAVKTVPMEDIVTNVMNDAVKHTNVIALLHDSRSKRTTVDGLPLLIETLINAGFEICPIDDSTIPVQHRKRN